MVRFNLPHQNEIELTSTAYVSFRLFFIPTKLLCPLNIKHPMLIIPTVNSFQRLLRISVVDVAVVSFILFV